MHSLPFNSLLSPPPPSPQTGRDQSGVRDAAQLKVAKKKLKLTQRSFARKGTQGESDRSIRAKKPKHLFAGKRKKGKTGRR